MNRHIIIGGNPVKKNIAIFAAILTLLLVNTTLFAALDDDSLVLYLSFEEGSGDKAKDSSTYGHDGELIANPSRVNGQFGGKALEFDGTKGQHVKIPITDTLQLRESFSVAFWVKRGDTQASNWNYMVAAGNLKWAVIFNNGDQKTYVYARNQTNWARRSITTDNQPNDWVHIALTYDVNTEVLLYHDGQKASNGEKHPMVDEIDGSIMVGARHPGQEFFTGTIDEVYLFNRILSEKEINTIKDGDFAAVEPINKLATRWGVIKSKRHH